MVRFRVKRKITSKLIFNYQRALTANMDSVSGLYGKAAKR